jgi:hypothetical protein
MTGRRLAWQRKVKRATQDFQNGPLRGKRSGVIQLLNRRIFSSWRIAIGIVPTHTSRAPAVGLGALVAERRVVLPLLKAKEPRHADPTIFGRP